MSEREFLTSDETAAKLRIHRRTLLTMVRNRKIPHVRLGRKFLFRWEDIVQKITQEKDK